MIYIDCKVVERERKRLLVKKRRILVDNLTENKSLEHKFDEIFIESASSLDKLYRKSGVEESSAGFASHILSVAFSISLRAYFDGLIESGGNRNTANLAILNSFSQMFKNEFLDAISRSIRGLRGIY